MMRGEKRHLGRRHRDGRGIKRGFAAIACVGLGCAAFAAGCTGDTVKPAEGKAAATAIGKLPEVSPTGPHPKAVIEETVYHFGTMEHGSEGEHAFVIKNEGEAPLELYSNPSESSCQCTIGKVGNTSVAPGESTEITLSWNIKSAAPKFSHFAKVRTNDPEKTTIDLRVEGFVGQHLSIRPTGNWSMGRVETEDETVITGTVHSETVDEFKILKVESSSPYLVAETRVLDPGEVADLRVPEMSMESFAGGPEEFEQAKQDAINNAPPPTYGYELTAKLKKGMPLGAFKINLAIHTDIEKAPITNLTVTGTRVGPIEVVPIGRHAWSSKTMRLRLDEFPASKGQKLTMMLFVTIPEGLNFEIQEITTDPEVLKATHEKDEKFPGQGRERHFVHLEIPPGAPAHSRMRDGGTGPGPATVTVKTNHPEAAEVHFDIEYLSTPDK